MIKKLHLGCGNKKLKGYLNCDISPLVKPDKIVDLEKKLPFKDNSVDEIYSRHTFEHIKDLYSLMKELHRICKKNTIIKIITPYFSHPSASQDPSHVRFFTWKTLDYFEAENVLCFYSAPYFKIESKRLHFFRSVPLVGKVLSAFFTRIPNVYERFFAYALPATEIEYALKVLK